MAKSKKKEFVRVRPFKKRRPKTYYWGKELDDIVDRYNKSTDEEERNQLFNEHLHKPLLKMTESIIRRFKYIYLEEEFEVVQQNAIGHVIMSMSKFSPDKGKSYSYLGTCIKHFLILHNSNSYKSQNSTIYFSDQDSENGATLDETYGLSTTIPERQEDVSEFIQLLISYWEENAVHIFKRQQDVAVVYAILHLFRRAENIENTHRKAVILMIREMTGAKTTTITKIMSKMKSVVLEQMEQFHAEGKIGELMGITS